MRRIAWLPILALYCIFSLNTLRADEPVRDHDICIDDMETLATITGCVVSPDGKYVAFTDFRWRPESDRRDLDIWVASTAGDDVRRLTFESPMDGSPQWSPDSQWIYFTSARGDDDEPPYNGKKQVWRVSLDGERLVPVTRFEKGVSSYELSSDGRTLYYAKNRDQNDDEWKDLRAKHKDVIDYSHGQRTVSEIWKLDLRNWRTEKLVDEKQYIHAFHVSPDEKRIVMHVTFDDQLITNEGWSYVDVYDAATKKVTRLDDELYRADAESPHGWIEDIAWSPDSQALAYTVGWDGYPNELIIAEFKGDEIKQRKLDRPHDGMTITGSLRWRPGSRELCFLGEFHACQHVYGVADVRGGKQGTLSQLTPGAIQVGAFDFSEKGGKLVISYCDMAHMYDLYRVEAPGDYKQITDMNPQMKTWKMPQISIVSWKAPDGEMVEGILELPYGHDPEKDGALPMVLELHGGPTASTLSGFRFWCYGRTLMAAEGYALLSPNYRGSTGYGDKFLTDLVGHENDIEVKDILAGVDAMVERGIANPDKLGLMGWSNGGYMTNALITHTQRFKAASSGAGISDMMIQWGLEDTPGHVVNFMRGLPWQSPEAYHKASPLWDYGKVTTPTLIHCGGADSRVPLPHSQVLYRALHQYTHVPCMLLVYPDQGHGLGKLSMRKAKMEWDLAWFKKYLLGEGEKAE